ncbi:MFS transporter [Amanita muscaria]
MPEIDLSSPERQALLEKRVRWKLDIYVLLPVTLLLCMSFIEKSNIAYASIAGLIEDLDLQGTQFNNVISVSYATVAISAIPSTILMKKLRSNRVLGFLAGGSGIVIILTGLLVKNYPGMIAARLVLGALDGGIIPGFAFYLSLLYRRYELQSRIAICYAGGTFAGLFGGLFAGAIVTLDGRRNLSGWRWIFIIEGILLVVVAIVNTAVLPTNPATAWFLTEAEREHAAWRLGQDTVTQRSLETQETLQEKRDSKAGSSSSVDTEVEEFEWREIWRGALDIQTWLTGASLFLNLLTILSAVFFLPTIIVGLGYSGVQAQLHAVIVYILAVVLTVVVALLGDRLKLRGPFVLGALPLSMLGYIVMIASKSNATRFGGACLLIAGTNASVPPLMAIVANNSKGHYKRACAMALQSTFTSISGIPGTYIYTLNQKPRFIKGHSICLALLVVSWTLVAANVLYCIWENKARREGRRSGNIEKYQALRDAGKTRAPIGDRHPDFVFVL